MSTTPTQQQPSSPFAGWGVVVVILGLLLLVGLFYVTAGLSGLLFADGWPHQGFAQTSRSIVELRDHLDAPALAWPANDRNRISGPIPFYLLLVLLLTGMGYLTYRGIGWWQLYRSKFNGARPSSDSWATKQSLSDLLVDEPVPGRIGLGLFQKKLVAAFREHWVIVLGGARSRKSSQIVAPAIRDCTGKRVIVTTKPDLLVLTRAACSDAVVFDPGNVTSGDTVGWSPLDAIEEALMLDGRDAGWTAAQQVGRGMTSFSATSSLKDAKFWEETATALMGPLLLAAALAHERDVGDVCRWAKAESTKDAEQVLEHSPGARPALDSLKAFAAKEPRLKSSAFLTVQMALVAYDDPAILAGTRAARRFRPQWLLAPNAPGRTLFLLGTASEQDRLAPVFLGILDEIRRLLFTQAVKRMATRPPHALGPVMEPEESVLLVLDEAAHIAPIPDLDQLAATGGAHGLNGIIVYQDLSQARERLGADRANSIASNCQARVLTRGIGDPQTISHFQQLLGDEPVWSTSQTVGQDGGGSLSTAPQRWPIADATTLRSVPEGQAILVYSAYPPARIVLRATAPASSSIGTLRKRWLTMLRVFHRRS